MVKSWCVWPPVCRSLPYIAVALAVLGPALLPGYVFAPDMVFAPVMPFPAHVTPAYPLQTMLHYASLGIPAWLLQKALLLTIVAGSGIGAHRFAAYLLPRTVSSAARQYGCYAAGLLYMINPFVYSRLMAGQYYLLLGYMALPFFGRALWRFMDVPQLRTMVALAASLVTIGIVSPHIFGMAVLLLVTVAAARLWHNRRRQTWLRACVLYGIAALAVVLLTGSYWLMPLLHGHGAASVVNGFGAADRAAFATTGQGTGRLITVMGLQGFWGDAQNLYAVPSDICGWWWLPFVGLAALLCGGAIAGWRLRRGPTALLLAVMAVAALLAAGTPFNDWLATHVRLFAGYREPQKFVALLALGYAWLAACGTAAGITWLQRRQRMQTYIIPAAVAVIILPLLCTPLLLWGGNDQLRAAAYPPDWYAVDKLLTPAAPTTPPTVLCLPWHSYLRVGFAHAVVANPASQFFDAQVITNTNPEFEGASAYVTDAATRAAARLLQTAPTRTDMAAQLASQHIAYVLLLKEADYQQYQYLAAQPGLQPIYTGPTLTLYKVNPRSR